MTEDKATKLGIAVIAILLIIPLMFWNAWGLSWLWVWYVTPLFGIPVPALWQLVGLYMTVTYLTHKREPDRDGDGSQLGAKIMIGVFNPPITVGMGWLIKTWFGGV